MASTGSVSLPPTDEQIRENEKENLAERIRKSSNWFYWIAGLSVINTLLIILDMQWNFLIGLGITQVFAIFSIPVAAISCVIIGGGFVTFGYFARKCHTWAFAVGMGLYAIDALLFVIVKDWFGMIFHIVALGFLTPGLIAAFRYGKLVREAARSQYSLR
jgi:hypothetical protein